MQLTESQFVDYHSFFFNYSKKHFDEYCKVKSNTLRKEILDVLEFYLTYCMTKFKSKIFESEDHFKHSFMTHGIKFSFLKSQEYVIKNMNEIMALELKDQSIQISKFNSYYDHYTNSVEDNYMQALDKEEDDNSKGILQKYIDRMNATFKSFNVNKSHDLYMWTSWRKGLTAEQIMEDLKIGISPHTVELMIASLKRIEFRLTLSLIIHDDILVESQRLKMINLMPAQAKYFFGLKKLDKLPSFNEVKRAIQGEPYKDTRYSKIEAKERKELLPENDLINLAAKMHPLLTPLIGKTTLMKSHIDFNGKIHKKACVFLLKSGHLYDHVTRITKEVKS